MSASHVYTFTNAKELCSEQRNKNDIWPNKICMWEVIGNLYCTSTHTTDAKIDPFGVTLRYKRVGQCCKCNCILTKQCRHVIRRRLHRTCLSSEPMLNIIHWQTPIWIAAIMPSSPCLHPSYFVQMPVCKGSARLKFE